MQKKFLCALLIGCCVLGLSACGKSEAEQAADYYENELGMDRDDAEELANAVYGDEKKPEATEAPTPEPIVACEAIGEILSAEKFSNKIQLVNTAYTFPLTVGELLQNGELCLGGYGYSHVVWDETAPVKPMEKVHIIIEGNGVNFSLDVENNTDTLLELKDCVIASGTIGADSVEDENVIFPGGLKMGMSSDEFVEIYGEPDEVNTNWEEYEECYKYFDECTEDSYVGKYSPTGFSYDVRVDMDTKEVKEIRYTIGNRNRELEKEFALKEGKMYQYYMPGDLKADGRMMIEVEGEKYIISKGVGFWENPFEDASEEELKYFYGDLISYKQNSDGTVCAIRIEEKNDYFYGYWGHYIIKENCIDIYIGCEQGVEKIESEALQLELLSLLTEIMENGIVMK